MRILVAVILSLILMAPTSAIAVEEIFKLELVGTEMCGNFDKRGVTYPPLYALNSDDGSILVSASPTFDAILFTLLGEGYATTRIRNARGRVIGARATFYAIAFASESDFLSITGTSNVNLAGDVTSVSGTFLDSTVADDGCFTTGKFKSVQRLQ